MIKKFIDKLLGKSPGGKGGKPSFGKRQDVGPTEHGIDPSLVDERALNVVHTLKEAGFEAYIVGGACAICSSDCGPRISTWLPAPRPSRSGASSGGPSSLAGGFASCTWCSGADASTR